MKLILKKDQDLYFSSDPHYGHKNICEGVTEWKKGEGDSKTRPFNTLSEMNDSIVNNINARVKEDDVFVCLGDWSFGGFENVKKFRDRIQCKNVHLFYGNHDHHIKNNRENVQDLFASTQWYDEIDIRRPSKADKGRVDKHSFVCMHFPIASWDKLGKGKRHLHGHVHLPPHLKLGAGKSLDVGVDGNNFKPYKLEEILTMMKSQPNKGLSIKDDHHIELGKVNM